MLISHQHSQRGLAFRTEHGSSQEQALIYGTKSSSSPTPSRDFHPHLPRSVFPYDPSLVGGGGGVLDDVVDGVVVGDVVSDELSLADHLSDVEQTVSLDGL